MTIMPVQLLLAVILFLSHYLYLRYACYGHTFNNAEPLPKALAEKLHWANKIVSQLKLKLTFAEVVEDKATGVSYAEYLGPDYEKEYKEPKSGVPSTLIPNQLSNYDVPAILQCMTGGTCAVGAIEYLKIPVVGFMCQTMQMIVVERAGS
jgi:1-acyl-sn-glycerol-3-phosphate acyltransferase